MKLIVGIGNPGKKYEFTRHNAGFIILDKFASDYKLTFRPSKYDFYKADGDINSVRFFLIKPTTYVNNSGLAILDFLNDTPLAIEDILVIHDDLNIEPGKIKIKRSGSAGGHNGLESIIYHLENDQFSRIRFGIGNNFGKGEMADYVLEKFGKEEEESLIPGINLSMDLIRSFILNGYKGMADFYAKSNQPAKNGGNEPQIE